MNERQRVFFALLDPQGNPVELKVLWKDMWLPVSDPYLYFLVRYRLFYDETIDGAGTGYEWTNKAYDFSMDSLSDPEKPPTEDEALAIFYDLIEKLDLNLNNTFDLVFCFQTKNFD